MTRLTAFYNEMTVSVDVISLGIERFNTVSLNFSIEKPKKSRLEK